MYIAFRTSTFPPLHETMEQLVAYHQTGKIQLAQDGEGKGERKGENMHIMHTVKVNADPPHPFDYLFKEK